MKISGEMLKYIERFEITKKVCEIYYETLGYDLQKTIKKQILRGEIDFIQPMIISINYIIWEILKLLKMPKPKLIAGHSLGEYSALVASGIINFKTAISLVYLREKYMRLSCIKEESSMAVIMGISFAEYNILREKAIRENEILDVACINTVNQIVISGHKNSIEKLVILAKKIGKVVRYIEVGTPSHSSLMKKVVSQFRKKLQLVDIKNAKIPIIYNVNAKTTLSKFDTRSLLAKQLIQPVQWLKTMSEAEDKDTALIIECGSGGVFCNFSRKALFSECNRITGFTLIERIFNRL